MENNITNSKHLVKFYNIIKFRFYQKNQQCSQKIIIIYSKSILHISFHDNLTAYKNLISFATCQEMSQSIGKEMIIFTTVNCRVPPNGKRWGNKIDAFQNHCWRFDFIIRLEEVAFLHIRIRYCFSISMMQCKTYHFQKDTF